MNRRRVRRYNYMISEINAIYHDLAVRTGLSDSAQSVLYAICESGEKCLQSDIYKQTDVSRQTINTAIRRLEKDGLVYLEQGQGRNTIVCLTEAGRAFTNQKVRPLLKLEDEILSAWAEQELNLYLELTERYRDALRSGVEELCAKL